ncbi:SPATA4, partial [Symbiodinium sp. CCMP2456]
MLSHVSQLADLRKTAEKEKVRLREEKEPERTLARHSGAMGGARWPFLLLLLDHGCRVASAGDEESTLGFLFGMGGDYVFPLMDFVASESEDIDHEVARIDAQLARVGDARQQVEQMALKMRHGLPSDAAALAGWLLRSDWSSLLDGDQPEDPLVESLAELTPGESTCDDANTGGDKDFIYAIRRSLDGLETLALEQNEFKWAEFFARRMRQQPVCLLGISSLFLVAADVTAFAAAASGGEHQMRVRRALLFAQGLALQHVEEGPSASQGARALDLLRTRWPLWQLLRSVRKEMASGSRFALPAPRRAALPETALELPE